MTAQLGICFDEGARRRDVGHESALSHYAVTDVNEAIIDVARKKFRFTSEDVLEELSPTTRASLAKYPNALGACIRKAAKAHLIEPTGDYQAAGRPEARKRKLAVWRSGNRHIRDQLAAAEFGGLRPEKG